MLCSPCSLSPFETRRVKYIDIRESDQTPRLQSIMAKVSRIQQCGLDVLYNPTYLDNFPPSTLTSYHIRPFETQSFLPKDVQCVISSIHNLPRVNPF